MSSDLFTKMTAQRKSNRANGPLPARGVDWLHNPVFNKGTAFTEAERDLLGLRGLLPPARPDHGRAGASA